MTDERIFTMSEVAKVSEAKKPVLEGTFTMDGRKVWTLFTRLREEMATYTLELVPTA